MGILDSLASLAGGTGGKTNLLNAVMGVVTSQQGGGLAGLVQQFEGERIGRHCQILGGHRPEPADHRHSRFSRRSGRTPSEQLAAKAGIDPQQVTAHLTELLPKLVDKLTPDGKNTPGRHRIERSGHLERDAEISGVRMNMSHRASFAVRHCIITPSRALPGSPGSTVPLTGRKQLNLVPESEMLSTSFQTVREFREAKQTEAPTGREQQRLVSAGSGRGSKARLSRYMGANGLSDRLKGYA